MIEVHLVKSSDEDSNKGVYANVSSGH
jgi:hypothetical protein